jgi:hypothetical protein
VPHLRPFERVRRWLRSFDWYSAGILIRDINRLSKVDKFTVLPLLPRVLLELISTMKKTIAKDEDEKESERSLVLELEQDERYL